MNKHVKAIYKHMLSSNWRLDFIWRDQENQAGITVHYLRLEHIIGRARWKMKITTNPYLIEAPERIHLSYAKDD